MCGYTISVTSLTALGSPRQECSIQFYISHAFWLSGETTAKSQHFIKIKQQSCLTKIELPHTVWLTLTQAFNWHYTVTQTHIFTLKKRPQCILFEQFISTTGSKLCHVKLCKIRIPLPISCFSRPLCVVDLPTSHGSYPLSYSGPTTQGKPLTGYRVRCNHRVIYKMSMGVTCHRLVCVKIQRWRVCVRARVCSRTLEYVTFVFIDWRLFDVFVWLLRGVRLMIIYSVCTIVWVKLYT